MIAVAASGRGAAWATAEYLGYPLLMFAATPLFLHLLGQQVYGQWMLLLTLNGLGGLAGIGMGTAATREVAAHLGRSDRTGAAHAAQSCLSVTLVASAAIATLLAIAASLAPASFFARIGEAEVIRLIVLAGAAMIILEQVDTVFAGTIRGFERYDVSAKIEMTAKLAIVVASILAAAISRSLAAVVLATLTLMSVRSAIKALVAARLLGLRMLWPRWHRYHVAVAFDFGKWTWAQAMGAALFSSADRLLVGGIMGAASLAHYSIGVQLAQQVQTLPAAGAQVLLPRVSRMVEQGTPYGAMAIRLAWGVAALSAVLALGLTLVGHRLIDLWVDAAIATALAVTLPLLALGYAVLGALVVPHYVLLGEGRARLVAVTNIVAGVASMAVAWVLIPTLGLAGAALGRLCYAVVVSLYLPAMLRGRDGVGMRNPS